MAIVILGGLITSTALNLLVLPTLALRYGHFQNVESEELATRAHDATPPQSARGYGTAARCSSLAAA